MTKKKPQQESWIKSPHSEYEIHTKKIWLLDKKGEAKNPQHAKLYKEYNDLWEITEPSDKEKIKQLDKLQGKINLMLELPFYEEGKKELSLGMSEGDPITGQ